MKRVCVIFFLGILYTPIILGIITGTTTIPIDVPLIGYIESIDKPVFSWASFITGKYQEEISLWFNMNLYPRGILTRTYSSINYNLFHIGNRPIGDNGDIFEEQYINAELCIGDRYNYSIDVNKTSMENFISELSSVHKKLNSINKSLLIYIAPNKADFNFENIPQKYIDISSNDSQKVIDCFREQIEQTDIPYMICSDLKKELAYPAFYPTGIHWSRTFEQIVTNRLIAQISSISQKQYRNIILNHVKSSNTPFWRDGDLFELLNVWNKVNGTYYEYIAEKEYPEQYDKMRFLIWGDSFAEGLRKDILDNYPYEDIYYINYVNYVLDKYGTKTELNNSWDNFDFNYYLDRTDAVVIGITESFLNDYTIGFIDQLDAFLDTYIPEKTREQYMDFLDAESNNKWKYEFLNGIYEKEKNYVWLNPYSEFSLCDPQITRDGLELVFNITEEIFYDDKPQEVIIYINGKRIYRNKFSKICLESVLITAEELMKLKEEGDIYNIGIYCSKSFVPKNVGINDERELGIVLKYAGRSRR